MAPFEAVPIQSVESYWDRRPCNVRHSTAPIGTRQYFDEVERRKYFVEPHIPGFARFPEWGGKRVLEVGCGIGTDTINFARAGAHVTAVDLSRESLALARERASVFELADRIDFIQADVEALSEILPVQPFDLIYSFGVLHHTPHPDVAARQLRRYATDRTVLKVMVYHRLSWKTLGLLASSGKGKFWKLDAVVAEGSEAQTGCPVTYSYSKRRAREWLENAGFRVEECAIDHVFPYRIADYIEYRYVKEPWFRPLPRPVFRVLEKSLGWHLLVTGQGPPS